MRLDHGLPSNRSAAGATSNTGSGRTAARGPPNRTWTTICDHDLSVGSASRALAVVRELAQERGPLCFDPQVLQVYQASEPADTDARPVTLEVYGGKTFSNPNETLIEKNVRDWDLSTSDTMCVSSPDSILKRPWGCGSPRWPHQLRSTLRSLPVATGACCVGNGEVDSQNRSSCRISSSHNP